MPRVLPGRRERETRLDRGRSHPEPPTPELPVPAPLYERQSLLREAQREIRSLRQYGHLVGYLVNTTLRKETTGRVLGVLWWLLDPLLLMAVYVLLIGIILNRGGENFALFVLTALISWKHFSSACGTAMAATVAREPLMRQIAFPRTVLPLSAVLATTVHFLVGLALLVVIAVPFGIYPSPLLPVAIVVLAVQLLFALGFGFALAGINFFFRDVQPLAAHSFRFWFYLSPGLYAVTAVPERYRTLYELNPFATLFPAYRSIVLDHAMPNFSQLVIVAAAGALTLVLGFLTFVRLENSFTKVS